MIRSTTLILAFSCVLSSAGFGQAQASQQPQSPAAAPPPPAASAAPPAASPAPAANPAAVAPSQAVITLKGACDPKAGSPAPAANCVSSVTKEQFEKLTNALKPDITPDEKRNLAQNYGKLLVFADTARALGLENDPKVREMFKFYQDQILAQAVNQHYAQEYAHPSDQQIEDYYKQNSSKYLEATLQRIVVPRITAATDKPKPSEADEKAYIEQVRNQWVGGGDPAKLQAEAMAHAGVKTPAPDVNVGARRPGSLPVQHEAVFDLKAGEISQPYSDPSSFYLYKVVSVRQIPLSEVKDAIARQLSQQMIRDKMESIANSVTPELNETYFGPAPQGPPLGAMGRPGSPASQGARPPQAPPPSQAPPK